MKIPVTNNGTSAIFVGSLMVQPGETRLFEAHEVPEHLKPQPAAAPEAPVAPQAPDPDAALKELAAKAAPEIIAALPEVKSEDLGKLEELEKAREKPRKTVLEAIAETILERAGDPQE